MKIYFLSAKPCALFINDAYFGMTNHFEKFASIDPRDRLFVRFVPESAQPIAFFLHENIRSTPPDGCEVYILNDGLAIYAKDFTPLATPLRVIAQARFEENLVTVYQQGAVQLALETAQGAFCDTLSQDFCNCQIEYRNGFFLLRSSLTLCIYTRAGARVFSERVRSYALEGIVLRVVIPLHDALARVAECTYTLDDGECQRTSLSIRQSRTQSGETAPDKIRDELLPYAFFESMLLGLNYEDLLTEELREDASKLKSYLGEFVAVVVTDEPTRCGLVKPKAPRVFEVTYYTVTIENGKIADLQG